MAGIRPAFGNATCSIRIERYRRGDHPLSLYQRSPHKIPVLHQNPSHRLVSHSGHTFGSPDDADTVRTVRSRSLHQYSTLENGTMSCISRNATVIRQQCLRPTITVHRHSWLLQSSVLPVVGPTRLTILFAQRREPCARSVSNRSPLNSRKMCGGPLIQR
jgi:hypothetical protein